MMIPIVPNVTFELYAYVYRIQLVSAAFVFLVLHCRPQLVAVFFKVNLFDSYVREKDDEEFSFFIRTPVR